MPVIGALWPLAFGLWPGRSRRGQIIRAAPIVADVPTGGLALLTQNVKTAAKAKAERLGYPSYSSPRAQIARDRRTDRSVCVKGLNA